MNQILNRSRILAISLSTYGFGYAVMEGNDRLIDHGHKVISKEKNRGSLSHIEKMMIRNQPDILVLHAVNAKGSCRAPRIKVLHKLVLALAKERKLKVVVFIGTELRNALLGDPKGKKHEMAELLARQFPNELASRLPPKRKAWSSEDSRMDIFDAVGLGLCWIQIGAK